MAANIVAIARGTATTRAFQVPELLELITLELPMGDILIIQRVCQDWRDAIKDSKVVQRKWFLEPALDTPSILPDKSSIRQNFTELMALGHDSCCNPRPTFKPQLQDKRKGIYTFIPVPDDTKHPHTANPI